MVIVNENLWYGTLTGALHHELALFGIAIDKDLFDFPDATLLEQHLGTCTKRAYRSTVHDYLSHTLLKCLFGLFILFEIGRASCRVRVRVWMGGVGGDKKSASKCRVCCTDS